MGRKTMKVRLVKLGESPPDKKDNQRAADVPIVDTIRSWVKDFRLGKANRASVDFGRISGSMKR